MGTHSSLSWRGAWALVLDECDVRTTEMNGQGPVRYGPVDGGFCDWLAVANRSDCPGNAIFAGTITCASHGVCVGMCRGTGWKHDAGDFRSWQRFVFSLSRFGGGEREREREKKCYELLSEDKGGHW